MCKHKKNSKKRSAVVQVFRLWSFRQCIE